MTSRTHKKHVVQLSSEQRIQIEKVADARRLPVRPRLRLQVLLLADQSSHGPGLTDEQIHQQTHLSVRTIEWIRATYCEQGLETLTSWRGRSLLNSGAAR
jgi:hypothetical protein